MKRTILFYVKYMIFCIVILLSCSKEYNEQESDIFELVNNYLLTSFEDFKSDQKEIINITKLLKSGYDPNLYIKRGFYYLASFQIEEAKRDFSFVLQIDSENVGALTGLAFYYSKINDYDSFGYYANKLFSINPDEVAYYLRSKTHDNLDSQLKDLDYSLKLNPHFHIIYLIKATALEINDSLELALKVIDTVITKKPSADILSLYYTARRSINEKLKSYDSVLVDLSRMAKLELWSKEYILEEKIRIYKRLNDDVKVEQLEEELRNYEKKKTLKE